MPSPHHRLCKVSGCFVAVQPPKLLCPEHWAKVPADLRNNIIKHYTRGVHVDNQPAHDFNRAVLSATQHVAITESQERRASKSKK